MVFEESATLFSKTLQVLYQGGSSECQEAFLDFVSKLTSNDEDPSISSFIKQVLSDFKKNFAEQFAESNLKGLGIA